MTTKDFQTKRPLAIFLGYFGIHNFYLGYTGKAIAQLLLTILSCGTLCIVSEIWAFVEAILIFAGKIATDANGVPSIRFPVFECLREAGKGVSYE